MSESDLGRIAMVLGHHEEAIARMQEAIRLYGQLGDQAHLATEHLNLSYALNVIGDHEQALDVATARLSFVQERGDTYLISALACNAAEACALLGRLDEADRYAGLALRQEEEFHRHYILTVQGIVAGKRDDHVQATQLLEAAIQLARESEDPFGEAPAWRWLALDYAAHGSLDDARAAMSRAAALYGKMDQVHEVARCEALARRWDNLD
jgi:tetratricopeptide (TPR) repeat protein